jgi:predicted ester cyclase
MAVDIQQAARRLFEEAWGKGNYGVMDEICDPSYRGHDPVTGELDIRAAKEMCRTYREAFPDLGASFLGLHLAGDTCVVHWRMTGTHQRALMGLGPTGKRCTVEGMTIMKFRRGRCVEDWTQWDALGLYRQLGVAPAVSEQGARSETQPHA